MAQSCQQLHQGNGSRCPNGVASGQPAAPGIETGRVHPLLLQGVGEGQSLYGEGIVQFDGIQLPGGGVFPGQQRRGSLPGTGEGCFGVGAEREAGLPPRGWMQTMLAAGPFGGQQDQGGPIGLG